MRSVPVLLAALVACSDSTAPGDLPLALETVATGLAFPLDLASPPGDPRLFVVEKGGRVRILRNGAVGNTPFLDLSGRVSTGSEQGLLALAFDPAYATTGRFVVNYTDATVTPGSRPFTSPPIPTWPMHPARRCCCRSASRSPTTMAASWLRAGPASLYWAGDGGSSGDPNGNGQSLGTLLGKLLRVDLNGAPTVCNPAR